MPRSLLRQYFAYLLIALMPLQAMAIGKLAVCVDMANAAHKTITMDHCSHMADMSPMSNDDSTSHSHKTTNCWIGSICLAQVVMFAVPMKSASAGIERSIPTYPSIVTHYRSVILDDPQRPPVVL